MSYTQYHIYKYIYLCKQQCTNEPGVTNAHSHENLHIMDTCPATHTAVTIHNQEAYVNKDRET